MSQPTKSLSEKRFLVISLLLQRREPQCYKMFFDTQDNVNSYISIKMTDKQFLTPMRNTECVLPECIYDIEDVISYLQEGQFSVYTKIICFSCKKEIKMRDFVYDESFHDMIKLVWSRLNSATMQICESVFVYKDGQWNPNVPTYLQLIEQCQSETLSSILNLQQPQIMSGLRNVLCLPQMEDFQEQELEELFNQFKNRKRKELEVSQVSSAVFFRIFDIELFNHDLTLLQSQMASDNIITFIMKYLEGQQAWNSLEVKHVEMPRYLLLCFEVQSKSKQDNANTKIFHQSCRQWESKKLIQSFTHLLGMFRCDNRWFTMLLVFRHSSLYIYDYMSQELANHDMTYVQQVAKNVIFNVIGFQVKNVNLPIVRFKHNFIAQNSLECLLLCYEIFVSKDTKHLTEQTDLSPKQILTFQSKIECVLLKLKFNPIMQIVYIDLYKENGNASAHQSKRSAKHFPVQKSLQNELQNTNHQLAQNVEKIKDKRDQYNIFQKQQINRYSSKLLQETDSEEKVITSGPKEGIFFEKTSHRQKGDINNVNIKENLQEDERSIFDLAKERFNTENVFDVIEAPLFSNPIANKLELEFEQQQQQYNNQLVSHQQQSNLDQQQQQQNISKTDENVKQKQSQNLIKRIERAQRHWQFDSQFEDQSSNSTKQNIKNSNEKQKSNYLSEGPLDFPRHIKFRQATPEQDKAYKTRQTNQNSSINKEEEEENEDRYFQKEARQVRYSIKETALKRGLFKHQQQVQKMGQKHISEIMGEIDQLENRGMVGGLLHDTALKRRLSEEMRLLKDKVPLGLAQLHEQVKRQNRQAAMPIHKADFNVKSKQFKKQ